VVQVKEGSVIGSLAW